MSVSLLGFLALISVMSFLSPDRDFSENENRYLADAPTLSLDNILDAKFQDGLEEYLNDQIYYRDGWITIKTAIQKAMGDTDIGGAYVGKDGYDFEKITSDDVDDKLVKKNTKELKEYLNYCNESIDASRISVVIVPTSGLVLADKLPDYAPLFDQSAYIDSILSDMQGYNVVDVRDTLISKKDEGVYYRTDHHWTSKGAFLTYAKWCESMGLACEEENYTVTTVTNEFRGSLYSKILDHDSAYDSIECYKKTGSESSFVITLDGKEVDDFYHYDKLEEKDKYLFFFGGNYGEVVIDKQGEKELEQERNLLLIKDSFANSFVPFVAEDYDHVYMIDLRYCREDMRAYLEEHNITDVMVLYNISNFISDKNIYKLNTGK